MAEEEIEVVSLETLRSCGQVIEYRRPGNKIKDMLCPVCGGSYSCTHDFLLHKNGEFHKKAISNPKNLSSGKLTPTDLDKLPWAVLRSCKGWWVRSEDAPYLRDAINNGHNIIGGYKYFMYASNACIGRTVDK